MWTRTKAAASFVLASFNAVFSLLALFQGDMEEEVTNVRLASMSRCGSVHTATQHYSSLLTEPGVKNTVSQQTPALADSVR